MDWWLEQFTPEQFDEVVAFNRIEPDPAIRFRRIVTLGFCALAHAAGLKLEPADIDPALEQEETPEISPRQAAAALRQRYEV